MTDREELSPIADEDLDAAQGAGTTLTTQNNVKEVAGITADQKTIIGGFKSMTGMDSHPDPTFMADVFNEPHD